jgi:hypothetical protein
LKLSLFGSAPDQDFAALVRRKAGRRVNFIDPDLSLLLLKATESIAHGGGERFAADSEAYEVLHRWIAAGTPNQSTRALERIELQPTTRLLSEVGQSAEVSIEAIFDDGTHSDVTRWAVIQPDDEEAVTIDRTENRLTVHRRGEHRLTVRFLDQVKVMRVGVPFGPPTTAASRRAVNRNPIDQPIQRRLDELGIPASGIVDDYGFARRVFLDLTGRVPLPEELESFVTDEAKDKRERLIDRLLQSREFADYWSFQWAQILAIDSDRLGAEGAAAFHDWLTGRFDDDAPWSDSATAMLTSSGDGFQIGPVNFLRGGGGPDELAEDATRVFMGVRLRCANCHDHPLDHWKQDDYHGLAAIFAKLSRGRVVEVRERGEVTHPVTGEAAIQRIPGERDLAAGADGRVMFSDWLVDPANPYFARAAVNRIWNQLLGRGLIEPVDDLRSTNPPTHPQVLELLADEFVESGFRFKPVIRLICNSSTYQRSHETTPGNQADRTYYSHALEQPLDAEVIVDAIVDVTEVQSSISLDSDERLINLSSRRVESRTLDVLGRCDPTTTCETRTSQQGSLEMALHLINGEWVNEAIESENGWLARQMKTNPSTADIVDKLYLRVLARPARESEHVFWQQQLNDAGLPSGASKVLPKHRGFFEDVTWSLLTSDAFLTNH